MVIGSSNCPVVGYKFVPEMSIRFPIAPLEGVKEVMVITGVALTTFLPQLSKMHSKMSQKKLAFPFIGIAVGQLARVISEFVFILGKVE